MPVVIPEMKVCIALVMSMGLNVKPDIDAHWSTDEVVHTPFYSKTMTRDRFLLIHSNLHISDIRDARGNDPLAKVRLFLTMIQRTFCDVFSIYPIKRHQRPWKGRLRFKVYNPNKPSKFGIKLYQANESATGYDIAFEIYTGKNAGPSMTVDMAEFVGVSPEANTTTKLVVGLLASCGLLNKGYHIYLDNYYTSPELYDELRTHDTYAYGTVRRNRKDVPNAFSQVRLPQGEVIFRRRDGLLAVKYRDKRDVHMLSTIHVADAVKIRKRDDTVVTKPTCIVDYTALKPDQPLRPR